VVLSGLPLLEADAQFHAGQLALYRARREGSATSTEKRFRELKQTSRLADGRLREARALAVWRLATASAGADHAPDEARNGPGPLQLDRVTHAPGAGGDKERGPRIGSRHWTGTEPPRHASSSSAELNLASDGHAPGAARRTLRIVCEGSDRVAIADAELAVTEIVTNAVLHAGGDGVSISFWSEGPTLDVVVDDGGRGFSPRMGSPDDDQIGGRGLSLVDTLAESWGSSICDPSSVWMRFAMPDDAGAHLKTKAPAVSAHFGPLTRKGQR
jgi:anti-sigma regulatory factor (Ser/Thr protein kinase)